VTLILLTFSITLIVHIPFVQRWGVGKLTASMSKTLNTRVSLGGFSINPISDLTLKDIFIASPEHPEDTLIYALKLSVDYKRIWDIFYRRITINQVGIENGFLNIHRISGDSLTNLDLALLRMMPTANPAKSAFVLDLKSFHASSLAVRVDDETFGTLMNMYVNRADVKLDTFDITAKHIAISDLDLDQPQISIVNRPPMAERETAAPASTKLWYLDVAFLRLTDGKFSLDNRTKPEVLYPESRGIDYAHMVLEDVDIAMDSLVIKGWDFTARDIDIHLLHQNGFEINTMAAKHAAITKEGIILDGLHIKTPDSEIDNSISLLFSGFKDFGSFVDSVKLDIPDANIRLNIADLLSIAPGLQSVTFFKENEDDDFILQGKVTGHVNRLRIKNMNVGLGDISMTGDFRSRDLAVAGSQLISLDLQRSRFSARSLKKLFPKMNIPPQLNKLGNISFSGKIDGYPDDFVAYGTFVTELGNITLDMNLDIVEGMKKGNYSGSISLKNFDLGAFTENPDLGRVTMSGRVIEGIGLTSESIYADVTAQLSSLTYKGYVYQNARVDGQLAGKLFNGTLDINDPNIDMHFEGTVNMMDSLPRFDFISRINSIDFRALGLTKDSITVQGVFDVNMRVGRFNQILGKFDGEQIVLMVKGVNYSLDSLHFRAEKDSLSADNIYTIQSDIVSGVIKGDFDPTSLVGQMQDYLHSVYPRAIDPPAKPSKPLGTQRLSWDLLVHDSKHWTDLAGVQSLRVKRASLKGSLDMQEQKTIGEIRLPEIHYENSSAYEVTVAFAESKGKMDVDLELVAADFKESMFFEDVFVTASATDDSVNINFKTDQLADIIEELDLDVSAKPDGGNWAISFHPNKLGMLGGDWQIPAGNKVDIRKGEFEIQNFELFSETRKIVLDDINYKGLEAYISGFDISYLNELWINDKFDFSGEYTLDAEIDNLYDIRQLEVVLSLPELRVNNVPYGNLLLNAMMNDPKDSVKINIALQNKETSLTGKGAYLPPIKSIPEANRNYLRMDLIAKEFPLDFLEFLLGSNIRDTEGSVDMTLSLKGKANALNPNGKGIVYNGSTTIDYLGAGYSFHEQSFTITETMIDLSGIKMYDVLGNTATVQGGMTHRYLRDLGFAATLTSDHILGLDVTSEENNVFYGKGIGSVYAVFSGTVANPKMVINSTTARGTHIFIPLSAGRADTDKDFVVFLENGILPVVPPTQINIGGVDLTMIMNITEDAIVEIVFDDNTGEVLRGQGNGTLTLATDRLGNFTMHGDFTIEQGDYLFTNFRVVRKSFELVKGGTIRWDGDPPCIIIISIQLWQTQNQVVIIHMDTTNQCK
ncbi:MAG TPA: translocation/assembly module TamB domain-containing protein, partial [Saprospiraceae bacterium]